VDQARPLAWWRFRILALIGLLLSWLPSGAVFYLDGFFRTHGQLRNPFAVLLITAEVAAVCYVVYRVLRRLDPQA
jgi:hypothetical protein